MRLGYGGASTAQIARLARVSKRDLYAVFASKQAMLCASVMERTERMRRPLNLPPPGDLAGLNATLIQYGMTFLLELSRPEVMATHRLAIAESENAPELARTLDSSGRMETRLAMVRLFTTCCERGVLGGAEPIEMVEVFHAILMREGLMVRMLMRTAPAPDEADARQRAEAAAETLSRLYGKPA